METPPGRAKRDSFKNPLVQGMFDEEKKAVGGFLLFFCIIRTVVSPIYLAIQYAFLFRMLGGIGTVFSRFPIVFLLLGCDALLTVLGIWAGILIWDLRASGVRIAKIYLVLGIVVPVAIGLGLQVLGYGAIAERIGAGLAGTFIFNTFWFIYLCTSERVKSLYEIEAEKKSVG